MPKEKINLTLDINTLVKAHVLSNLFHGSNISALVTGLINNFYVQNRTVITDDDVKEAQLIVAKAIEKREKNRKNKNEISNLSKPVNELNEDINDINNVIESKPKNIKPNENRNLIEEDNKEDKKIEHNSNILNEKGYDEDIAFLDSILLLYGYSMDKVSEEQRNRLLNIIKVPQFTFEQKIKMIENFIGIMPKNSNTDETAASIETEEQVKESGNEDNYTALVLDIKNTKGVSKYLDD